MFPRFRFSRFIFTLAAVLIISPAATVQTGHAEQAKTDKALWDRFFGGGGVVALMRHALAPGGGDPENFTIGDCSTQRNLSEEGRAQARATGNLIRGLHDGKPLKVKLHTSRWCRCRETAELLDFGKPEELSALNSLHGRPQNTRKQVRALKALISGLPPDAPPHLMVSHHATIRALTGRGTASGGIVIVKGDGAGIEVLGRIDALPTR